MKAAVLAMLLAMAGHGGMQAAGTGNVKLGEGSRVTDEFDYQLAAGNLAATSADYAAVYGYMNSAGGAYSTALGSGLVTTEGNTFYNSATGTYSTAIGYANTATVGRSTAVGYRNDANIDYGTSVGVYNLSKGMYGTAVGYGDSATGNYSTAVGNKSSASGTFSTAIGAGEEGTTNSASGIYSSAFGFRNSAGSDYSQAFGTSNTATTLATGAIVMGSENTADGENANAFGYKNQASSDQTMSVGAQNITVGRAATTMGFKNTTGATDTMALGVSNSATGIYAMATGQSNSAAGAYAFAEGTRNVSGAYDAVSQKTTQYTTAIGYGNTATGVTDVGEDAEGDYAGGSTVALGDSNKVTVNDSVALGRSNTITGGHESVAFGYSNKLNDRTAGIAAAFGGGNKVDSDSDQHPAAAFGYENTTVGIAVGYHNTGVKTEAKDVETTPGTTAYVYPVAIGSENEDSGIGSFNTGSGIGYANTVDPAYTTANAVGTQNSAIKKAAIAIGYKNEAGGDADKEDEGGNSNAIGVLNVAGGTNSGAFGYRNYAGAENSIAMGAGNNMESFSTSAYTAATTGTGTVAVGYKNNAQTANSTVFGYLNKALIFDTREGMTETSSGENALFGSENTGYGKDAVALGYKNTTGNGSQSSTYGRPSTVTHHTIAVGNQNTATGVLGTSDSTGNGNTIAVGYQNTVTDNYSKAFGVSNRLYGSNNSAFGYDNQFGYSDSYHYGSYNSALGVSNRIESYTTGWSSTYITAIGKSNEIYERVSKSIAAGYSNKIYYYGEYESAFGVGNTIEYANNSTVAGFSNIMGTSTDSTTNNTILGSENTITYNTDYSSILGRGNSLTRNSDHVISLGTMNKNDSTWLYYSGSLGTHNNLSRGRQHYTIGANNYTNTDWDASDGQSISVGYSNYLTAPDYAKDTYIGVGNNNTSRVNFSYTTLIGINNNPTSGRSNDGELTHIGSNNTVYGRYATALGQENSGSSSSSNALGKSNALNTSSSTAVGYSNIVGKGGGDSYNTAVGTGNIAGSSTRYNYSYGTSTGYATSVGSGNNTSSPNSSSFGVNNVIAGSNGTDYNGNSYVADYNYYRTDYSATIGIGNRIRSSGNYSDYQDGQRSYALGIDNITRNRASTALGAENIVGGSYTGTNYYNGEYDRSYFNVAIGVGNQAGGTWYSANDIHSYNGQYNSYYTLTGGFENRVTGYRNAAFGYDNVVSGNGTMDQGKYIVTESAALGQSNIVKSAANRTDDKNTSRNAGGMGSYVLGHDNVSQAPYSTAVGAANTVGGTQSYNSWSVGGTTGYELDNTALGTGNAVGAGAFQETYYGTDYVTRPHNTYAGTGIGFQNKVGSNHVTAAGYGNTVVNGDKGTGTNDLGVYTVTYSAALGQNNRIQAIGEMVSSGNDTYVMGGEYSYAIGYGNTTQFAGSTALGFSNTVGADSAARSVIDVVANAYFNVNTAIGTSNVVGGLFVTDEDGKQYQVSYATAIGVSNAVAGEEATAVGVSNTITKSREGHHNKDEKNRSAALGSRNTIENSIDTVGVTETIYGDVYNYALGNDNLVTGSGNLAVGRENTVGGASSKQQTADAANTAIGANNVVGGKYVDAEFGEANGRYNLAAGFGNFAIGQENTAIGIENTIAENAGALEDSTNSTQHNVLVGILNTVSNATYTAPRMYNVAIGEGNEMRNGYDTAIGFYNTVGGALAANVDNTETMYHVALGSQNQIIGTDGEANAAQMTAIGSGNTTYGRDSVVIGKSSVTGTADQENDTRESAAIGVRAVASSMKSLAVGVDVTASEVTGTVAVGQDSTVSGSLSSAFGVSNTVTGEKSLALGTDNEDVFGNQTIVVGTNNQSAVTADADPVGTANSVIFGVDSSVTGDRGVAFGVQDTAAGGAVAAGYHSSASGDHSLAMGYAQTVTGAHGTAVGSGYSRTEGSGESQTTYYYGTEVSGVSGAAFGVANLVRGNYATAVGAGYYRHTEINQEGVDYFFQNTAAGDYSAAFGYLNVANGEHSLAAGTGFVETVDDVDTLYANIADRARSAALGYANQALAEESLAAGGFSRTGEDAKGATAVGEGYVVELEDSSGTTTVRRYNEATGAGATALGFANIASGTASTAAGGLSKASKANATALGVGILKETIENDKVTAVEYIENEATEEGATAIGYANSASGKSSSAMGSLSKASGVGATAAGAGYTKADGTLVYNEADGDGALAYGYANIARGNNATAIGSMITVDGTESINQALSAGSTAIGSGNTAGATDKETATAIGVKNTATGANAVAIGSSNEALADGSVFLGISNTTTTAGTYATAIGVGNVLGGEYSLAFGNNNQAKQAYAIAIGMEAQTGDTGSHQIAMSYQAKATGDKAIAIGYQAQAAAANSIAFGTNAQATFANSVAIGTDSVATDSRRDLEKQYETAGRRTTHTVSFGNSTTTDNVTTGTVSRLTNVAEGRETKDTSGWLIAGVGDTDAVNVKQLKRYINTVPVFYDHRDADATPFTAEGSYITTGDHWLSTDFWQDDVSHGTDSTAYGYLANATGVQASALGYNAKAEGTDSIAMIGATATGENGIAIGSGASAETGAALGTGATSTGAGYAIGTNAQAAGEHQLTLGGGNTAGAEYTISVGNGTDNFRIVNLADAQTDKTKSDYDGTAAVNVETMKKVLDTMQKSEAIVIYDDDTDGTDWRTSNNHWVATDFDLNDNDSLYTHGLDSTGYGYATKATGTNATAVGYGKSASEMTAATADYASAFGTLDTASGLYSLAAGVENIASGNYATAVGYTSVADKAQATALGYAAKATGEGATAVGSNATASAKGALAIGSSYDDATLGTLKATASGEGATAIGLGVTADGAKALALGALNTMSAAQDSSAVGVGNTMTGSSRSGAFGTSNKVSSSQEGYALGFYNQVSGADATALGYANTVSADNGTAAGYGSQVSGARGFAAGVNATAQGADAMAAGSFAVAAGASSTAVGAQAYATVANSTAIGYQATATDSRVADDGTDAKINTVSFGHKETDIDPFGTAYGTALTSRLTHIADGVSDTDAANVRQLKESVIVDFDENYETSLDHRLSTDFGYEDKITHGKNSAAYGYRANAAGENSVALGYQAYAGDANGVALGAESVAVGNVVSVGHREGDTYQYVDDEGNVQEGTYDSDLTRRITNVAKGIDDTDLINVAQLKEETRTAGIVKWDGVEGTSGKHYLATFFENTNYYTPGENSSAYGYLTKATGAGSVAFGYAAQALVDNAVALGSESVANDNVISIGHAKTDLDKDGNAYGTELTRKIIHVADGVTDETAENYTGTDLVNVRTLKTTDPVKTGTTDGGQWLATSETADVSYTPGKYAAAYGSSSEATGASSVAFGYGAKATAENAVALGEGSVADTANTVSVGKAAEVSPYGGIITPGVYRRIVNVANGVADHDLITYAQLKAATVEGGIVDYDTAYADSGKHWLSTSFATDAEKPSLTRGEESVAFGYQAKVAEGADRGTALGYNASVTVADGVAIGANSVASVAGTVSVGHTEDDINPLTGEKYGTDLTRVITGLAFGEDGTDAVSVDQLKYTDPVKTGTTATATGENHYLTTLDPTKYKPGENSVAYGLGTGVGTANGAWAPAKNAVAFGLDAYAMTEGSVALGADSVASEANTVSLGHKTTDINRETGVFYETELTRKITGVADGIWDENNAYYNGGTDLVNVRVLNENTKDAPGIVRTIGDQHNLYTELNDSGNVNPASQAVAYGKQAYAKEENSVALGYQSYAGVAGGVALGANSVAKEENTVSVGHQEGDTYYDYDDSGNYVEKQYEGTLLRRVTGLAFGVADTDAVSVAQLKLTDPVKTGTTDGVTETNHWLATPMGGANYARGENSVAYGYGTAATAKGAVAFGYAALAQQENAVAIGADSVAKSADTVSFGHRQGDTKEDRSAYDDNLARRIIHVADGVADTDLINVSQLEAKVDLIQVIDWDKNRGATGQKWLSTDFGKTGLTHGYGSTAYGNYANAQGTLSAAIGYGAVATADNSVALGRYATASQADTVSVGHLATDIDPTTITTENPTGTAYGTALTQRITNVATGTAATDLINVAQLKLTDPVKTGTNPEVTEENHYLAMDFGSGIQGTPGTNSVAYGYRAVAEGENAVAVGYQAYAKADNSVALGAYSAAGEEDTVSVGHKSDDLDSDGITFGDNLTRKIIHVADGILDKDNLNYTGTDLVTVAQLRVAAATSGGVVEFNGNYDDENDHYLSTYIAEDGGATHNATSAAYGFKANVAADATNGAALGYGASVTAANATAIGAGAIANEANIVSVGDGTKDGNRRITNVANGVTDQTADNYNDGTDAVTVGQLYAFYLPKSGTYEEGETGNRWVATTFGKPIDPGENSTSYGADSAATGDRSTAFGYGATATDDDSVVLGAGSTSAGKNTISVGDASSGLYRRITNAETGEGPYDAITLGYLEQAIRDKAGIVDYDFDYAETGEHWLATSFLETAEEKEHIERGKESIAFGYTSVAKGDYSAAFGYGAQAALEKSTAIGAGSVAYEANTISVGAAGAERRIMNVAKGVDATDAINVSQLEAVKDLLLINGVKDGTTLKQDIEDLTGGTAVFKEDVKNFSDETAATQKVLDDNGITKDSNINGRLTDVETKMDGLIGGDTTKEGTDSSIIGYGNTTKGDQSSAYGYKNEATGDQSTATGSKNVTSGNQSSAYGSGNTAGDARDPTKTGQTAIGTDNLVTGQDATGIGTANTVTGEHATGNGYQNSVSGQDSIGTGSGNHVDGSHSAAYGFDNHVTGDGALAYGSGNEARGDGTVAIGQNAWATGDGGVAMGTGSRAVENSVAIGAGSVATEKGTVSFGNADEGTTSRLVNLKDGEAASDIATYGQLETVKTKVTDLDNRIKDISEDTYNSKFDQMEGLIGKTEENISKVGAGAAAMAALHPLEFDPSEKISFAIGYGNYRGENAMAVGAFVRPNESITLSLGGSVGNGDNLVNSSISFALGSGPSGLAARSKTALAKQVNEQDEKIAARDEEIARLRSLISQLEAMAETEEQKVMAHEMVIRSEAAELEELRGMAQQLVATASADQLRSIVKQLSANQAT